MDYFTSDLHIGHDKDFIWKARGFNSIEEHDTQVLKNWNSIIKPEDTVYILGDLCMGGDEKEWNRICKNLNGFKNIIYGNHDTIKKLSKYVNDYDMHLIGYADMYRYSKKRNFYLSHYPTLVNNHEDKKFLWCLSGHTHCSNRFENGKGCVYNVALDAHNCTPVSIEQIIKDIDKYRQKILQKKEN